MEDDKLSYRVYAEGYSSTHNVTGETKYFGRLTLETRTMLEYGFNNVTMYDWEVLDTETAWIEDKWRSPEIKLVIGDNDWEYPEFTNGLIHIYEGNNYEEAISQFEEYKQSK